MFGYINLSLLEPKYFRIFSPFNNEVKLPNMGPILKKYCKSHRNRKFSNINVFIEWPGSILTNR